MVHSLRSESEAKLSLSGKAMTQHREHLKTNENKKAKASGRKERVHQDMSQRANKYTDIFFYFPSTLDKGSNLFLSCSGALPHLMVSFISAPAPPTFSLLPEVAALVLCDAWPRSRRGLDAFVASGAPTLVFLHCRPPDTESEERSTFNPEKYFGGLDGL